MSNILYFKKRILLYGVDMCVAILFGVITGVIHYTMSPYDRFFTERDPFLSYPYYVIFGSRSQEVPDWLVLILVFPVPIVFIVIWCLVWKFACKLEPHDRRTLDILLGLLSFLEAMTITLALTEFLKNFVGRKRPNFFAMCNYHGYRNALLTGNFSYYNAHTEPGVPGDISNCLEIDEKIVHDSQLSFPSGHSSTSFCALVFCGLFVMNTLHSWSKRHNMLKGLMLSCFVWVAAVVAGTRPRDYWHNFDDVLGGVAIGITMALFVYYLNYGLLNPEEDELEGRDVMKFKTTDGVAVV